MQLFPLPNTTGIGAGGLTNNYQRDETRTVDRDNYDLKLNWNRTTSQQIWGKYSFMNAVVDDLTNYLGPDPNATGDGGFTKVWQFTTRHDLDAHADDDDGHHVRVLAAGPGGARSRLPATATTAWTCWAFLARTTRASAIQRYAGYPQFNTGFSAARQPRRLESDLPRRAHVLAGGERHQAEGASRSARRLLPQLHVSRPLAAGDRQPARQFHVQWEHHVGEPGQRRRRISTISTRRSCSALSATSTRACRTS